MIVKILISLAAILAVLTVVIALQSSDFRVTRSATFTAPPNVVFAQVNDLHAWEAWSPWAKIDPMMKTRYEGAASGAGASYVWSGNNEAGEGRSTIIESRPDELIRMKLEFVRPFAGTNDVEFAFKPEADRTVVTWSMEGKKNFISKAVGLVLDCEKMCGGYFEQGFASLRTIVETKVPDERQTQRFQSTKAVHAS